MPGAAIDAGETKFVCDLLAKIVAGMAAILEDEVVVVRCTGEVAQAYSCLGDDAGI